MVEDTIPTFETFCRNQDVALLACGPDFTHLYHDLVRLYAGFADPEVSAHSWRAGVSPPMAMRWRIVGLRAIRSVVGEEEGLVDDELLNIVLPVILKNLSPPPPPPPPTTGRGAGSGGAGDEETLLATVQSRLSESDTQPDNQKKKKENDETDDALMTVGRRISSRTADDADRKVDLGARQLALACLEHAVVSAGNRGQTRAATYVVLQFIAGLSPSEASGGKALVELIAKWSPVQVRFVILVTTMEELLGTTEDVQRACTFASVVEWLLKSSLNMIGLSVMDVLLGLLRCLMNQSQQLQQQVEKVENVHLISILERSIGNLATHIYYSDQIDDIVRAILLRIRVDQQQEGNHYYSSSSSSAQQQQSIRFTTGPGKVAVLRCIKNVLHVADARRRSSVASGGGEARRPVGIYVWEGTHWLLCDPDPHVQHAYVDAFLTWLKSETGKDDLLVRSRGDDHNNSDADGDNNIAKKYSTSDLSELAAAGSRRAAASPSQREKAQTNFLRMFHVTMYEMAFTSSSKEVALLHLLLTRLVDHLGINAVRYGLPMILRLQDDGMSSGFASPTQRVNIGSLVYGYLWAVADKFDLVDNNNNIGAGILREIDRRKKLGCWNSIVQVPPLPLDEISSGDQGNDNKGEEYASSHQLTSFQSTDELVDQLDRAYTTSFTPGGGGSPTSSSASPEEKRRSVFISHSTLAASLEKMEILPASVKEEMLSPWTKEACLAAAENDSVRAMSNTAGSRNETSTYRNNNHRRYNYYHENNGVVPAASAAATASAVNNNNGGGGGVDESSVKSSSQRNNNLFVRKREDSLSLVTPSSTSRGSAIRVNELKRVLSSSSKQATSPLSGRLVDQSSLSSSGGGGGDESVATASVSSAGGELPSEAGVVAEGEATPKASMTDISKSSSAAAAGYQNDAPSIPPFISDMPGGYPRTGDRTTTGRKNSVTRNGSTNGEGTTSDERDELKNLVNGFLLSTPTKTKNGKEEEGGKENTTPTPPITVNGGLLESGIGKPPY